MSTTTTTQAREASAAGSGGGAWTPVSEALPPPGRWMVTRREGEAGENLCLHHGDDGEGDIEWVDATGRTTVTSSVFAPPTHWREPSGLLADAVALLDTYARAAARARQQAEASGQRDAARIATKDAALEGVVQALRGRVHSGAALAAIGACEAAARA